MTLLLPSVKQQYGAESSLWYTNQKIRDDHLQRTVQIYVRQSWQIQVLRNTVSGERQHALVRLARELGWAEDRIDLIDDDQGRSATTTENRDGFAHILAAISEGQVGAVLCVSDDRVARDCADWHQLLKLCLIAGTLFIDETGVYDPRDYADLFTLGIKGLLSHSEGLKIKKRKLDHIKQAALQCRLRIRLPVGFVYDRAGQVVLDPDRDVRRCVRLMFELFNKYGSASLVVRHFYRKKLLFRARVWGGAARGSLHWKPLTLATVLSILHNPKYTGAYVYGQTKLLLTAGFDGAISIHRRRVRIGSEDWLTCIRNTYPAYITWDQYLRNQKRLENNRNLPDQNCSGAVRSGSALLQGLVRCGLCGRRMSVEYRKSAKISRYACKQDRFNHGKNLCQSLVGAELEDAVSQLFLTAVSPTQVEAAIEIADSEGGMHDVESQQRSRLRHAEAEVSLARRRYEKVDPEHRLAARELERAWNEKMIEVERLRKEFESEPIQGEPPLSPSERRRMRSLSREVEVLWRSESTAPATRKQLLRLLIVEVVVTRIDSDVFARVCWQTGVSTSLVVRLTLSRPSYRTSPEVVDLIRD